MNEPKPDGSNPHSALPKMPLKEALAICHEEIARLAYLNWEKDNRPHGHDQKYWLEAEQQIKATRHLLANELSPPANQTLAAAKSTSNGKIKKAPGHGTGAISLKR